MVRILMHGCSGRMGKAIEELLIEEENLIIVAGVDAYTGGKKKYPTYESLSACEEEADVVIDFSNAGAVDDLLAFCVSKKLPLVLCTTGLSEKQLADVVSVATKIPILKSANMSLGINLLLEMLKDATRILATKGYDIEVLERHHNQKVDAPSGTALALADAINEEMESPYQYVYDRSPVRQKRGNNEMGIVALRGGSIVGEHEVMFAGPDEVITFKHTAYSRTVFAKGAMEAARFLVNQPPGMYSMSDVIGLKD